MKWSNSSLLFSWSYFSLPCLFNLFLSISIDVMLIIWSLSWSQANTSATGEGSQDNSAPNSENNRGLKFSLWKKEDGNENRSGLAKWTCSKMRVMGRTMIIANSDHMISSEAQTNIALMKSEDQKQKSSDPPMQNNDNGSNSSSSNSNSPIRVCSDCNTTKTPLWRSGPRGPKVNT